MNVEMGFMVVAGFLAAGAYCLNLKALALLDEAKGIRDEAQGILDESTKILAECKR